MGFCLNYDIKLVHFQSSGVSVELLFSDLCLKTATEIFTSQ